MKPIIEVKNLSRYFKVKDKIITAVDNLSFAIEEGSIFGLLGPNGAGKSTAIKMMSTLLIPDSGEISVLGYDIYKDEKKIRPNISLLYGGEHGLYAQLNARDNLRFFGSLYKIKKDILEEKINYWLNRVGLEEQQFQLVGGFSKGMKQRLHIARAMLHDPEILFLDEPTLGLDPKGTIELREIIKELKARGKTIILTTHDMEEAQELCDQVAFIMDGKLIQKGTLSDLQSVLQQNHTYEIETYLYPKDLLEKFSGSLIDGYSISGLQLGGYISKFSLPKTETGDTILNKIISDLAEYNIRQVICKKMDLRTMYLKLLNDQAS